MLALCPFLLIMKKQVLAEQMAVYAYLWLVASVMLQGCGKGVLRAVEKVEDENAEFETCRKIGMRRYDEGPLSRV